MEGLSLGHAPAAPANPSFPFRVAGVDIGSNAIRFLVTEFTSNGESRTIESQRRPIRLGHDVFLTGRLTEAAMEAAIAALREFREIWTACDVSTVRAVATSAMREANNGDAFAQRIRAELGLPLEVIPGAEEARLVHMAIRSRVAMGNSRWLSVDVGGGSVEISLVDKDGILWSESHAMGSVRLLEELSQAGEEPGRFRRLLEEYLGVLHLPEIAERYQPAGLIATGGNIESLVKHFSGGESEGVNSISLPTLRAAIETLSRLSYRQRIEELGLRPDRADVILPAAMVYERVATLAGAQEILVPFVGVRDGVVLDLADHVVCPNDSELRRDRQVDSACLALGRRYLFDEAHCAHVAVLARSLYDQLKGVLGLSDEDRRILSAASLLHDVGGFISTKSHHKHSHYILSNSEIPGLGSEDIRLVALVARFHRKSEPSLHHEEFAVLSGPNQERVQFLAGLLRLADALDREHLQRVRSLQVKIKGGQLILALQAGGDLALERWSIQKKAQLITRLLNLTLVINSNRLPERPKASVFKAG
jgi:exopolyphosphatase/guanosine-5'-triphosphate,3'-diphosphate pyrophosphatase